MTILKKIAARWLCRKPQAKPLKSYHHSNIKKVDGLFSIKGKTVLVVGCSTGIDCKLFIQHGALRVDGLDVSEKIGADYKHRRVTYVQNSAENMADIGDSTYDVVYCLATLEHVPNIDRALAEIVRVTKPGGHMYAYSAPLWNSSQGHHKANFFEEYPWVHLRLEKDRIIEYCRDHNIYDESKNIPMKEHVAYMLSPEYFNKIAAYQYMDICGTLKNIEIMKNELVFDDEALLTDEIYTELMKRGLSRKELLAKGHLFIARKNAGNDSSQRDGS